MQEAQYALHAEIELGHWWFAARRAIVRALVERALGPRKRACIVDVGCGTGANIASFADRHECFGIDASPHAIERARARFGQIQFACEDDFLARRDWLARADAVLLMDVIEHVEDDFRLLSTVLSLVRPGTQILITVPADAALWSPHDETFGHWRRYDLARLRATWQGLAARERMLSHYNARLYPVIRAVRALTSRSGKSAGVGGSDFAMPPPFANRALERVFAGESRALLASVDRGGAPAYARGASAIALLERGAEPIAVRAKPAGLAPDRWNPKTR